MRKSFATTTVMLAATCAVATVTAYGAENVGTQAAAEQPTLAWHVSVVPANAKVGEEVEVVFTADIAPGWILYSSDFHLEIGPRPTKFAFDASSGLTPAGNVQAVKPQWKNDRALGGKYSYFARHAEFRQKAQLVTSAENVTGRISGQTCFEENGLCKLFQENFSARR